MKQLSITIKIPLQQFYPNYFCQFFALHCNKIHEIIAYCYKIFEVVNCLLQQQIYYYIKIVIKIFKVYCNEIFLQHKPITSNLIATLHINYCNDSDVIATIFFIVINIFCCSVLYLADHCNTPVCQSGFHVVNLVGHNFQHTDLTQSQSFSFNMLVLVFTLGLHVMSVYNSYKCKVK